MQAYLDNSATTRPSEGVIDGMARALREEYFNPSSLYAPALLPERMMNRCRETLARAVCLPSARVIFVSGGTEGNNLALIGAVRALRLRPRVLISAAEHPSVTEAAASLNALGYETGVIGVNARGELDYDALKRELQMGAGLVSVMQVNNETGAVTDVKRLSETVRSLSPGAILHIDGVQGFLRVPFDMRMADLYTLSAHKIHGPKGVGALIAGPSVRLMAAHVGGGQERELRSGTENTPGIYGLMAAVQEMTAMDDRTDTLYALKRALYNGLKAEIPELVVNGPDIDAGAPHILNVSFPPVRGEVMLHALESEGVYVSTGSACSSKKKKISPVLTAMGIRREIAECAVRFSLSVHTTLNEVEYACQVAARQYETLKRFQRR